MMKIDDPEKIKSEMPHQKELMRKLYETINERKKMRDQVTEEKETQTEGRHMGR